MARLGCRPAIALETKILNGTFAEVAKWAEALVHPKFSGGKLTMLYCGDDPAARAEVARILEQFGWEGADMGTSVAARAIEPLAVLWCIPGFRENHWTHAFKLLTR